jgi:hypothetical protein
MCLATGARPAAAQDDAPFTFANGRAAVLLPSEFRVRLERDGSLVAIFGPGDTHRLEISLVDYAGTPGGNDLAERFVRSMGEKQGRPVKRAHGKVVLFEEAGDFRRFEVDYRVARWQIGAGKSLFVMILTAPVADQLSPPLRDFVERRYDVILKTLRRTAA